MHEIGQGAAVVTEAVRKFGDARGKSQLLQGGTSGEGVQTQRNHIIRDGDSVKIDAFVEGPERESRESCEPFQFIEGVDGAPVENGAQVCDGGGFLVTDLSVGVGVEGADAEPLGLVVDEIDEPDPAVQRQGQNQFRIAGERLPGQVDLIGPAEGRGAGGVEHNLPFHLHHRGGGILRKYVKACQVSSLASRDRLHQILSEGRLSGSRFAAVLRP